MCRKIGWSTHNNRKLAGEIGGKKTDHLHRHCYRGVFLTVAFRFLRAWIMSLEVELYVCAFIFGLMRRQRATQNHMVCLLLRQNKQRHRVAGKVIQWFSSTSIKRQNQFNIPKCALSFPIAFGGRDCMIHGQLSRASHSPLSMSSLYLRLTNNPHSFAIIFDKQINSAPIKCVPCWLCKRRPIRIFRYQSPKPLYIMTHWRLSCRCCCCPIKP